MYAPYIHSLLGGIIIGYTYAFLFSKQKFFLSLRSSRKSYIWYILSSSFLRIAAIGAAFIIGIHYFEMIPSILIVSFFITFWIALMVLIGRAS